MKFLSTFAVALMATGAAAFSAIAPGAKIPSIEMDSGFPPEKVNMAEYTAGKNVFVVPGYLESQDALKEAGIDEVIVYCVNDGAVMTAWGKDQGIEDSMVKFFGDPSGAFTKAVDMEMTHPGPASVGIIGRCKRWAMHVVDGEVKGVAVAESEFDPAGDDFPEKTLASALIEMAKVAEEA